MSESPQPPEMLDCRNTRLTSPKRRKVVFMMLGLQRTLYRLRPTSAIGTICMLAVLVSLMGVDAASAQLQVSGSVVAAESPTATASRSGLMAMSSVLI